MSKKQSKAIQQPLDIVKEPTRSIGLLLPESVYQALKKYSHEQGRSMSKQSARLIMDGVKK